MHTNQPNHYSGKVFKNSLTYNGSEEEIVSDLKTYKYNDNSGNGFAVFTFLGETEQSIDLECLYSYTGSEQKFTSEQSGYYKIECWGASGGRARAGGSLAGSGGKGGYTSGIIYLNKNEDIYVYVGGKGADAVCYRDSERGYNGGGIGTWDRSDDEASGAGGGATDIRLVNGEWNDFNSLKSRIMVAGGGARNCLDYEY